jgi:hypothetical protein
MPKIRHSLLNVIRKERIVAGEKRERVHRRVAEERKRRNKMRRIH